MKLVCRFRLILLVLFFGISSRSLPQTSNPNIYNSDDQNKLTQLAVSRIQYVYKVRKMLGDEAWATFGRAQYSLPIIYYTNSATFIANPHPKFLNRFSPKLLFESSDLKIFRLNYRVDSARFHMNVSMSFGADTTAYDYYTPYIKCSSREEFESVTGHRPNTQGWTSMVLHEFFHGFQFLQSPYLQHAIQNNLIYPSIGQSLQQLYISHKWFKDYIDLENGLLLKAIDSKRKQETDSLIVEFFKVREERRSHIGSGSNQDFNLLEKSFETIEGTARFIESYTLAHPAVDDRLRVIDTSFRVNGNILTQLENLSKSISSSGSYYYATGYNMTRLLNKMRIDYPSMLFKKPSLTLEDILKQQKP